MIAADRLRTTGNHRMDLIGYLERAAVETDVRWRSGSAQAQSGTDGLQTDLSFADNAALARLLDARPTMICMIATPDGGDSDWTGESPDEPDEESPDTDTPDDPSDR